MNKNNMIDEMKKTNILNLANILTFSRVIITFVISYLIFSGFNIIYIVLLFIIGMLTDFFDGIAARKFKIKTEFGRQFDMIADRILLIGTAFSFLIKFTASGILSRNNIFEVFFILSREIISFPMVLIALFMKTGVPEVRFIGKLTTSLQGVSFPAIMLSTSYSFFNFSISLSILTGIIGAVSGIYYIYDVMKIASIKK
ncbi:MAG: CDP-alcohol phosphatidyltransferase family protein [Candidatus Pacebacteria bacterium]|nr:CDP-alcohol phosphatidyltransferase family protein [Candidatus Paceibacterota bacterium]